MKIILYLLLIIFLIGACVQSRELGTKQNPIKMYFVPSMEAGKIVTSAESIAKYLEEQTGYHFKVAVPTSYASVIEAIGTEETDIAWLATFGYILANQKFGAEVALTTIRKGLSEYRGQFVTKAGSGIDSIEDITGKVVAYTDAASTSGYIYPSAILKQKGIKPKNSFFAGGHPQAILAVYQGRADVGCTFWSPEGEDGEIYDARRAVIDTYSDVVDKIKIIGFTEWIPNDTVTFRKDFPSEMREEIVNALIKFTETAEGHKTLVELFDIDGFKKSSDSDYEVVRETLKALGADASDYLK